MKRATLRRIERVGYLAFDRSALRSGRPELGHGVKQHARIGMKGTAEHFPRRGDLNDAAQIHDADPACHVAHHREIVSDQKITQAQAILQVAHQIQHLRLNRDVKRRGRFV